MTYYIDIQRITQDPIPVADEQLKVWATLALKYTEQHDAELTIRLVDQDEIQQLNTTYRHQAKPTNVLSFPLEELEVGNYSELGDDVALGDIIFAFETMQNEAIQQEKSVQDHLAHLAVHGTLHLLGYDHEADDEAEIMEGVEIKILSGLGIADPY